uniref:Embryonic stem cell-specific 5-hydroxymethylcytosine-binding protein n=1 Tax=Oryza nivara TaxID=4536 RepID=A0A0E0HQX5_ORYNI
MAQIGPRFPQTRLPARPHPYLHADANASAALLSLSLARYSLHPLSHSPDAAASLLLSLSLTTCALAPPRALISVTPFASTTIAVAAAAAARRGLPSVRPVAPSHPDERKEGWEENGIMFRMMRCSDHFTLFFSEYEMCGRARCTLSPSQAARAFGFPTTTLVAGGGTGGGCGGGDAPAVPLLRMDRYRPSYNVSPGTYLPVGTVWARPAGYDGGGDMDGEVSVIQCMKWGLVPSFTGKKEKPDHFRMFNARSESIKEKASFRRLIPNNRCLVAVEGFYEWKKDGPKKMPYYIHFQDQRPLVFAALFDTWTNSEGLDIRVWYPVTAAIGKISFDGPECIKQVQMRPSEKPISTFFMKKPVKSEKKDQDHAETKAFRAANKEWHESAENQLDKTYQHQVEEEQDASIFNDQPITLEHDVEKAKTMKNDDLIFTDEATQKQDALRLKRKNEDDEVHADKVMEKNGRSPVHVKKKVKGPKPASVGQASLLSYFAKK